MTILIMLAKFAGLFKKYLLSLKSIRVIYRSLLIKPFL